MAELSHGEPDALPPVSPDTLPADALTCAGLKPHMEQLRRWLDHAFRRGESAESLVGMK